MSSKETSDQGSQLANKHLIHDPWFLGIGIGFFIASVGVWLGIMLSNPIGWIPSFKAEDVSRALELFKLPIGMLAAGATALAFYATIYRSRQTAEQIAISTRQAEVAIRQAETSTRAFVESNYNNAFSRFSSAYQSSSELLGKTIEFPHQAFFLRFIDKESLVASERFHWNLSFSDSSLAQAYYGLRYVANEYEKGDADKELLNSIFARSFGLLGRCKSELERAFMVKDVAITSQYAVDQDLLVLNSIRQIYSFLFNTLSLAGCKESADGFRRRAAFMNEVLSVIPNFLKAGLTIPSEELAKEWSTGKVSENYRIAKLVCRESDSLFKPWAGSGVGIPSQGIFTQEYEDKCFRYDKDDWSSEPL